MGSDFGRHRLRRLAGGHVRHAIILSIPGDELRDAVAERSLRAVAEVALGGADVGERDVYVAELRRTCLVVGDGLHVAILDHQIRSGNTSIAVV